MHVRFLLSLQAVKIIVAFSLVHPIISNHNIGVARLLCTRHLDSVLDFDNRLLLLFCSATHNHGCKLEVDTKQHEATELPYRCCRRSRIQ